MSSHKGQLIVACDVSSLPIVQVEHTHAFYFICRLFVAVHRGMQMRGGTRHYLCKFMDVFARRVCGSELWDFICRFRCDLHGIFSLSKFISFLFGREMSHYDVNEAYDICQAGGMCMEGSNILILASIILFPEQYVILI